MKQIAVAILNWNGIELLKEFLPSVITHSPEADIYLIDNNSSDDSVAFVKETYQEVKHIQTGDNLGYAGGYNYALKEIENEFVVLLNSDIEVTSNWLSAPLQELNSNPNIGALQPKILAYKQKDHFEYAGAAGGYIDYLGYPFCRGRLFDHLEEDQGQYESNEEIFWASGACMFVRRQAFFDAGQLDASFFAHMEEIDLCWRMQIKGYKIVYNHDSTVFHLGGGTLDAQSERKTFLNFRNNMFLLFKNLPSSQLFTTIFMRLILDGIAGVKYLASGKIKHTLAIVKAHFAFYGNFNRLAAQRRTYYKELNKVKVKGVYQNSIVLEHFAKKTKVFSDLKGKFSN